MMRNRAFAVLLVLSFVLTMVACSNSQTSAPTVQTETQTANTTTAAPVNNEPVYIAWYGPLSGMEKHYGDTEKVACELAMQRVNDNGGILGRPLVIDYYDDKNDAKEAIILANKFVGDDKYVAAVGSLASAVTMPAAQILQDAGIINYSPSASHADYASIGDYIFRNTVTQLIETANFADYFYNEMGKRTAAVIYVNDDWGVNVNDIFSRRFEELGGTMTGSESFLPAATSDFTPMLTKLKQGNPEAIYIVATYQDGANILKQIDQLDFETTRAISAACLKQETLDLTGEIANGCFVMTLFDPAFDNEEFQAVMGQYKDITGNMGDQYFMCTYDVVGQIAQAINHAGTTERKAVRDALATLEYKGVATTYNMNEIGEAMRPMFPMKVIDMEFVNIYGQPWTDD